MKRVVILSAGPGLKEIVVKHGHSSQWIPEILSEFNFNYKIKNVYLNEKCSIDEGDAWIISGSKYSVYDDIDWMPNLLKFVKKLIKKEKPILGICFGHQVVASALGADVIKNPKGWELGSYNISLTDLGKRNKLFDGFKDNDIVYESHQDIVTKLPENSQVLAYTDKSIQSFQSGINIYGVQFHPEFSWDITRMLMDLRLEKGIRIDNNHLEVSKNGYKILKNFAKMI